MRRYHLIEFHEKPWCPAILRNGIRGLLQRISRVLPGYEAILDELLTAMKDAGATEVVDLCSGAGGPWARIVQRLSPRTNLDRVLLTDLFPDLPSMQEMQRDTRGLTVPHGSPVDATAIPPGLRGFRTIFAAFHHFDPASARTVLASATATGEGVGIFELSERSWWSITFVMLATAPLTMVLLPFVRPFRWAYVPITYVVPLLPLMLTFDGLVSCLRTYRPSELLALAREAAPTLEWRAGRARPRFGLLPLTYLVGIPRR